MKFLINHMLHITITSRAERLNECETFKKRTDKRVNIITTIQSLSSETI